MNEVIICPGMTEKEKKNFLFINRGRTVYGPYEGIMRSRVNVVKDYSYSPDIDSAICLSARGHGKEIKVIKPLSRGFIKKYNPIGPEFLLGFGTKDR